MVGSRIQREQYASCQSCSRPKPSDNLPCLLLIEFDRLLQKHATETGLPVVVDFYSDSCGPCRMMAPIFKKVAAEYVDKAVFVKVDTNAQYDLSGRYQIRSLPTFQYFLGGRKVDQGVGGIGEAALRQQTDSVVRQAQAENVKLELQDLQTYYQQVDPSKSVTEIQTVYNKCVEMMMGNKQSKGSHHDVCAGAAANQLIRRLKQKYRTAPPTKERFSEQDRKGNNESSTHNSKQQQQQQQQQPKGKADKANLHLASLEQLVEEVERRQDALRDAQVDDEDPDEEENDSGFRSWSPSSYPERVVVVGGGPAGMAAAIYGARAGLSPLVIAPSMGGQLQGKGVDVENYPGIANMTGPGVIASMRQQAAHFGAYFEDDVVTAIDASSRPFRITTNATGTIEAHAIIVATGAEANWLHVPGEWELRGCGVSSCATCDGFLFSGRNVLVVGGGDAAMEDALVLARTSKSVIVVHRRDKFRASKVLADRVLQHPSITVQWNKVVKEIVGKQVEQEHDESQQDLDEMQRVVSGVVLEDVKTKKQRRLTVDAVFVAIGHTPSTSFLNGVVDFDPEHPGYVLTKAHSTHTSVPGIFAAGDVFDSIYRQAVTSAGSGAAAALDAERYLSEHGLGNEAADLEAELLAELAGDANPRGAYNAYDDAGAQTRGMKESFASEL